VTANSVTRCPVCDRQRQPCDKCSGAGLIPDMCGALGTCSACLGRGNVWITAAFRSEFIEGKGVRVVWDRCPDCGGEA